MATNGRLLKINDSSRDILSHIFSSGLYLYSPSRGRRIFYLQEINEGVRKFNTGFFSCVTRSGWMCLLFTKIIVMVIMKKERRHRRTMQRNLGKSAVLIKRVFEEERRAEEKRDGVVGLLFFATLSSPMERKYIRQCTVPERSPLEIRHGKVPEKKKQGEEKTGDARTTPKRETH